MRPYLRRSLFLAPLLAFAFAASRGALAANDPCEISGGDAGLSAELQSHVRGLKTGFFTYHYATARGMGIPAGSSLDLPLDLKDEKVSRHVQNWSATYLGRPDFGEVGADTKGLYLALDPVVSREFGGKGSDWVLYRVGLPASLPYLDLTAADAEGPYERISPEQVHRLEQAGCKRSRPPTPPEVFSYVDLFKQNQGLQCRRLVNCALERLKVEAIKYPYMRASFSNCPGADSGAFILIKTDRISPSQIAVFSKDTPEGGETGREKLAIEKLFQEAHAPYELWPGQGAVSDPGLEAWKKNHLLNCQDQGTGKNLGSVPCVPPNAAPLSDQVGSSIKKLGQAIHPEGL